MSRSSAPHGRRLLAARVGLHVLTGVLAVVTTLRALADGVNPWLVCGVAAVLLGCYGASGLFVVRRSRRGAAAWLGALTLLWAGALFVSLEFVWLAFPLLLLGGHLLSLLPASLFAAAVLAAAVGIPLSATRTVTPASIIGPLVGGVFAFGIARGYDALLRESAERSRLIDSLLAAQEEAAGLQDELARVQRESGAAQERARLARDIHDTIAQDLTAISLLARSGEDAAPRIAERADASLGDVRRIVAALLPDELETHALSDALVRLCERVSSEASLTIETRLDALPPLDTDTEVALLRAGQASLANVVRHARAGRVVVSLAEAGETVRLDIVDDGIGFDTSRPLPAHHVGIRALRERMRERGGGVDVESEPGRGTAVSAWLPLSAPQPRGGEVTS